MKKISFLLFLLLAKYVFAMDTPILSTSGSSLPTASGTTFNLMQDNGDGVSDTGWGATEAAKFEVVPIAGNFKNLYINLYTGNGTPGSGSSWVFTVRKNAANTAITCTIGTGVSSCNDTTHTVAFAAGDTIGVQLVSTSGASLPTTWARSSIVFSGNTNESIVLGSLNTTLATSGTNFMSPSGVVLQSTTESDQEIVMPTAGTFKNFRGKISGTPGASTRAYTWTFRKNGVDQTLLITFSSGATTASDTTHSFAVVAGDLISIKGTVVSTPTARNAAWGVQFAPTTDGEALAISGSISNLQTVGTNRPLPFNGWGTEIASAEYGNGPNIPAAFAVTKFYFASNSGSPGGSGTYVLSIQANGANVISMTLSGANGSVSNTTDFYNFSAADNIRIQYTQTGTVSAVNGARWGIVLAPTVSNPTIIYNATIYNATTY